MEILLIAIVVVVLGLLIFLNRKPKIQPEVKAAVQSVVCGDTDKDNKVEVPEVKETAAKPVAKKAPAKKTVAKKPVAKKATKPAKKTAAKK